MDSKLFKKFVFIIILSYGISVGILFGLTMAPDSVFTPFTQEKVELETVSGDVVESSIAYEELSTSDQELFRLAQSESSLYMSDLQDSELSGSVISLDGSYYYFDSNGQLSLLAIGALIIPILMTTGLIKISFTLEQKSEEFAKFFYILSIFFMFWLAGLTIHVFYMNGMVDENVFISSDPVSVSDPSSVVEVESLDSWERESVYDVVTGGESVSLDSVEYELLTYRASYVFTNYEYISSDGELYHIDVVEKDHSFTFDLLYLMMGLTFVGHIGMLLWYRSEN